MPDALRFERCAIQRTAIDEIEIRSPAGRARVAPHSGTLAQRVAYDVVDALTRQDAAALADQVRDLQSTVAHCRRWYAVRLEVLFHWAHKELSEAQRDRYFSIVANGTPTVNDPPTYGQLLSMAEHRAEAAEAEVLRLRALGVPASDGGQPK